MLKGTFLWYLLYASLLFLIIVDFFHGIPWYIQYGPMILAWIVVVIVAIFEKEEDKSGEKIPDYNKKNNNKTWIYFLLFTWLLVIFMNAVVGEPKAEIFNMYNPEFWVFVVLIPLLAAFTHKKRTDGT